MPFNPIDILRFGVIGLGFLLAFMAYRLLTIEQARDRTRKNVFTAIYIFMAFSVVLSMIGFADRIFAPNGQTPTITSEVRSPTPNIKAAEMTAEALVRSTATADFENYLVSHPSPNIKAAEMTAEVLVRSTATADFENYLVSHPTPTSPVTTPFPFTAIISEEGAEIIEAEDYSVYIGRGKKDNEDIQIIAAIERAQDSTLLGVQPDFTISGDEARIIVKYPVNVRKIPCELCPGFEPELTKLQPGQSLRIIGRNRNRDWWQIECPPNEPNIDYNSDDCWVWISEQKYDEKLRQYFRSEMDSINIVEKINVTYP